MRAVRLRLLPPRRGESLSSPRSSASRVRRVFEGGQNDRPLVDLEAEQPDLVPQGALSSQSAITSPPASASTMLTRPSLSAARGIGYCLGNVLRYLAGETSPRQLWLVDRADLQSTKPEDRVCRVAPIEQLAGDDDCRARGNCDWEDVRGRVPDLLTQDDAAVATSDLGPNAFTSALQLMSAVCRELSVKTSAIVQRTARSIALRRVCRARALLHHLLASRRRALHARDVPRLIGGLGTT